VTIAAAERTEIPESLRIASGDIVDVAITQLVDKGMHSVRLKMPKSVFK
jgi:acetamidase/formamidase